MKLSALAAFLMIMSCAASNSSPDAPWQIELTSSGGLAGRGAGSYTLASDGRVTVVNTAGKSCAFDADPSDLQRYAAVVAAARPESWQERYVPEESCCDRFEYTMTVDRGGARRTVVWIDDPLPMPADLKAVVDAMTSGEGSVRARYGGRCR
jgi:hypothetical protein